MKRNSGYIGPQVPMDITPLGSGVDPFQNSLVKGVNDTYDQYNAERESRWPTKPAIKRWYCEDYQGNVIDNSFAGVAGRLTTIWVELEGWASGSYMWYRCVQLSGTPMDWWGTWTNEHTGFFSRVDPRNYTASEAPGPNDPAGTIFTDMAVYGNSLSTVYHRTMPGFNPNHTNVSYKFEYFDNSGRFLGESPVIYYQTPTVTMSLDKTNINEGEEAILYLTSSNYMTVESEPLWPSGYADLHIRFSGLSANSKVKLTTDSSPISDADINIIDTWNLANSQTLTYSAASTPPNSDNVRFLRTNIKYGDLVSGISSVRISAISDFASDGSTESFQIDLLDYAWATGDYGTGYPVGPQASNVMQTLTFSINDTSTPVTGTITPVKTTIGEGEYLQFNVTASNYDPNYGDIEFEVVPGTGYESGDIIPESGEVNIVSGIGTFNVRSKDVSRFYEAGWRHTLNSTTEGTDAYLDARTTQIGNRLYISAPGSEGPNGQYYYQGHVVSYELANNALGIDTTTEQHLFWDETGPITPGYNFFGKNWLVASSNHLFVSSVSDSGGYSNGGTFIYDIPASGIVTSSTQQWVDFEVEPSDVPGTDVVGLQAGWYGVSGPNVQIRRRLDHSSTTNCFAMTAPSYGYGTSHPSNSSGSYISQCGLVNIFSINPSTGVVAHVQNIRPSTLQDYLGFGFSILMVENDLYIGAPGREYNLVRSYLNFALPYLGEFEHHRWNSSTSQYDYVSTYRQPQYLQPPGVNTTGDVEVGSNDYEGFGSDFKIIGNDFYVLQAIFDPTNNYYDENREAAIWKYTRDPSTGALSDPYQILAQSVLGPLAAPLASEGYGGEHWGINWEFFDGDKLLVTNAISAATFPQETQINFYTLGKEVDFFKAQATDIRYTSNNQTGFRARFCGITTVGSGPYTTSQINAGIKTDYRVLLSYHTSGSFTDYQYGTLQLTGYQTSNRDFTVNLNAPFHPAAIQLLDTSSSITIVDTNTTAGPKPSGTDITSAFYPLPARQINSNTYMGNSSDYTGPFDCSEVQTDFSGGTGVIIIGIKVTASTTYYNDVCIGGVQVLDSTKSSVLHSWMFYNSSGGTGATWRTKDTQYPGTSSPGPGGATPAIIKGYTNYTITTGVSVYKFSWATSTGSSYTGSAGGLANIGTYATSPMPLGNGVLTQSGSYYYAYRETSGSTRYSTAFMQSPAVAIPAGSWIRIGYAITGYSSYPMNPNDTIMVAVV